MMFTEIIKLISETPETLFFSSFFVFSSFFHESFSKNAMKKNFLKNLLSLTARLAVSEPDLQRAYTLRASMGVFHNWLARV